MLNYETLLSSYDDKLTLMQWLKKVEEALKDASAVAFKVNQRGNATLTFSVEFEDGTELETGPIVLQQGESVVSAAIVGGHLKLTLSNGDVLDAGDLGGVSSFSIDASQHLIVHYQNGTTQDLGAIFSGNVTLAGNLTAVGVHATGAVSGVSGNFSGNVGAGGSVSAAGSISSTAGSVSAAFALVAGTQVTTPKLTSANTEIEAEKPIIEKMTGYNFVKAPVISNLTTEYIYGGIVKNGNKLTFVIAVNITRTGTLDSGYIDFGYFVAPLDIMAKIYPVEIGGAYFIDLKETLLNAGFGSNKHCYCFSQKGTGTISCVAYVVDPNTTLDLNQKYYVRYECTLLLSENLAA